MHARIFKPAKSAMQSGRNKSGCWILEYERSGRSEPDPLIGWNGCADTRKQVRLSFDSCEQAVAYARTKGCTYTVHKPHERKIKPKSYADNFAYSRPEPWTH